MLHPLLGSASPGGYKRRHKPKPLSPAAARAKAARERLVECEAVKRKTEYFQSLYRRRLSVSRATPMFSSSPTNSTAKKPSARDRKNKRNVGVPWVTPPSSSAAAVAVNDSSKSTAMVLPSVYGGDKNNKRWRRRRRGGGRDTRRKPDVTKAWWPAQIALVNHTQCADDADIERQWPRRGSLAPSPHTPTTRKSVVYTPADATQQHRRRSIIAGQSYTPTMEEKLVAADEGDDATANDNSGGINWPRRGSLSVAHESDDRAAAGNGHRTRRRSTLSQIPLSLARRRSSALSHTLPVPDGSDARTLLPPIHATVSHEAVHSDNNKDDDDDGIGTQEPPSMERVVAVHGEPDRQTTVIRGNNDRVMASIIHDENTYGIIAFERAPSVECMIAIVKEVIVPEQPPEQPPEPQAVVSTVTTTTTTPPIIQQQCCDDHHDSDGDGDVEPEQVTACDDNRVHIQQRSVSTSTRTSFNNRRRSEPVLHQMNTHNVLYEYPHVRILAVPPPPPPQQQQQCQRPHTARGDVLQTLSGETLIRHLHGALNERCDVNAMEFIEYMNEFISLAATTFKLAVRDIPSSSSSPSVSEFYVEKDANGWNVLSTPQMHILWPSSSSTLHVSVSQLAHRAFSRVLTRLQYDDNNNDDSDSSSDHDGHFPIVLSYMGHTAIAFCRPCDTNSILSTIRHEINVNDKHPSTNMPPIDEKFNNSTYNDAGDDTAHDNSSTHHRRYRSECILALRYPSMNQQQHPEVYECWRNGRVADACDMYIHRIAVPAIVRALYARVNAGENPDTMNFAELFHSHGVNMRYIGHIRSQCRRNNALSDALLAEIIGRTLKYLLRKQLVDCMGSSSSPSQTIALFLRYITKITTTTAAHDDNDDDEITSYWRDNVLTSIHHHYGVIAVSTRELSDMLSVARTRSDTLMQTLSDTCGFRIRAFTTFTMAGALIPAHMIEITEPKAQHDDWRALVRSSIELRSLLQQQHNTTHAYACELHTYMGMVADTIVYCLSSCTFNTMAARELLRLQSYAYELSMDIEAADEQWLYMLCKGLPVARQHSLSYNPPPETYYIHGFDVAQTFRFQHDNAGVECIMRQAIEFIRTRHTRMPCIMQLPSSLASLNDFMQLSTSTELTERLRGIRDAGKASVRTFANKCVRYLHLPVDVNFDIDSVVEWIMDSKTSPMINDEQCRAFIDRYASECDYGSLVHQVCIIPQLDWSCILMCKRLCSVAISDNQAFWYQLLIESASAANVELLHAVLVQHVLNHTAEKSVETKSSMTAALIGACEHDENIEQRCQIIRLLGENGADMNNVYTDDNHDDDVDVNNTTTPLLTAAGTGCITMIQALFDAGATLDLEHATSTHAGTAVEIAAMRNHAETTAVLLRAVSNTRRPEFINRAFRVGVDYGCHDVVRRIINDFTRYIDIDAFDCTNFTDVTALMMAAQNGNEDVMAAVLQLQPSLDLENTDGWSAIMYACFQGHTAAMRLLIDHGDDVRVLYPDGSTLLHVACERGHADIVRLLLQHKHDDGGDDDDMVNATDALGRTPLVMSVISKCQSTDIIELLIAHNADCTVEVEVNDARDMKRSLLWFAVMMGERATVDALVHHMKKPPTRKWLARTLFEAVEYSKVKAVGHLVHMNVDVNAVVVDRKKSGRTALMIAAMQGKNDMVKVLLASNANHRLFDNTGCDAVRLARMNKHMHIVEFIEDRIACGSQHRRSSAREALLSAHSSRGSRNKKSSACVIQ